MTIYRKIILSIAICLLLAGCNRTLAIPQPTLEELLSDVNSQHYAVKKKLVDVNEYIRETVDQDAQEQYYISSAEEYDPDKKLTAEQAIEDVTFLFEALYNCYSMYDYFGGTEIFDEAENRILEEIEGREVITGEELQDLILKNAAFIKDGHFSVNGKAPNPVQIPFFFREVAFIKTEEGYRTLDGKRVRSVENCADLDSLFKLSISQNGELVYYPVLLKECDFWDALEAPQVCDETLKIHYTNGEILELTAEPYQIYTEIDSENPKEYERTLFYQNENIPVFRFNGFKTQYWNAILRGATLLKESPVSILDLRSNSGGEGDIAYGWMQEYAGQKVSSNRVWINVFTGEKLYDYREQWVRNQNILCILVGKYSASASELLLDISYNLENVLIIGENTMGAALGTANKIQLPNSGCSVTMGKGMLFLPNEGEDYFEELRGFYPDIWVPAREAETLTVKMMENLAKQ